MNKNEYIKAFCAGFVASGNVLTDVNLESAIIILNSIKNGKDPMQSLNEEYERIVTNIDSVFDSANKQRFFTELYRDLANM